MNKTKTNLYYFDDDLHRKRLDCKNKKDCGHFDKDAFQICIMSIFNKHTILQVLQVKIPHHTHLGGFQLQLLKNRYLTPLRLF